MWASAPTGGRGVEGPASPVPYCLLPVAYCLVRAANDRPYSVNFYK